MIAPVIILRPEPGAAATLAAARALGLHAYAFPLFAIGPMAWQPPPRDAVDALLLGSASALHHAGARLAVFADLPAYAVGEATGQAARAAGLRVVAIGEGGLQVLLDAEFATGIDRAHPRLLRLAGAERVALTPPAGVTLIERVVYAATPLPLPAALARLLLARALDRAMVVMHSAAAMEHFARECTRLGIARSRIALALIGPRLVAAAGGGWDAVQVAARPTDSALLALAGQMCETGKSH